MRNEDIRNWKSSASSEWFTPLEIIEAARLTMGWINLDPASCKAANKRVKARQYYDKATNGLEQSWYGAVWLNPPYGRYKGRSVAGIWAEKFFAEYMHGHVDQGCLLVPNATDTQWFQPLWDTILCFPPKRLAFTNPDGQKVAGNTSGSVIAYLGPYEERFAQFFEPIGHIVWP